MNQIRCRIFIGLTVALALSIPSLIADSVLAQAQNKTFLEKTNNTNVIWNVKDHTITLVNKATNETKSIGNFTTENETITANFKGLDGK